MGVHSPLLRKYVKDRPKGADIITRTKKKVDYKESTKGYAMFTLVAKDKRMDYLAFVDWDNDVYCVVPKTNFPVFTVKKRAIRTNHALRLSIINFESIKPMVEYVWNL